MRLLFVLPSFQAGGSEKVMLQVANGFARSGLSVWVCVLDDSGPFRSLVEPNVRVISLRSKRLRYSLSKLGVAIRNLNPNVIFSSLGYLNLGLLFLKPLFFNRSRLIIREANLPSLSFKNQSYPKVYSFLYLLFYRSASKIICSSERQKFELKVLTKADTDKFSVISNPVDSLSIRSYIRANAANFRVPATSYFVSVGRLVYQKGFDVLLESFAKMNYKSAKLLVVGDGEMRGKLLEQASRLGISARVELIGFQLEPWVLIRHAIAVVQASRWEGMSNVILESLACGTPVVTTPQAGGVAELVNEVPEFGLRLVDGTEHLTKTLDELALTGKRLAGSSLLPESYTLESVVEQYQQLIRE